MNIQEYRESKLNVKPTADIAERWQKRVVTRGLDTQGRAGGVAYLESYGKRIGAKKCVKFAVQAELMGAQEFANVLWEKAHVLEGGEYELLGSDDTSETPAHIIPISETLPEVDGLLPHLQPGKIATLQPQNIDRDWSLEILLKDDEFMAQPKYDGHRMLAICTPDEVWYQKRSLKLETAPSEPINRALQQLATKWGTMILDGELIWEDYVTLEHRTSAQAATANINGNKPEVMPVARYVIFDCLYMHDTDMTDRSFAARWFQLQSLYNRSPILRNGMVIALTVTFEDENSKRQLLGIQESSGREGVVFRHGPSAYIAGKTGTAYRHKFLMEHELEVTGLTETTAQGRQFGAIETPLGSVGTGFTDADQLVIKEAYENGGLMIDVTSQGLTENGRLWHPRFIKIVQ